MGGKFKDSFGVGEKSHEDTDRIRGEWYGTGDRKKAGSHEKTAQGLKKDLEL